MSKNTEQLSKVAENRNDTVSYHDEKSYYRSFFVVETPYLNKIW